LAKHARGDEPLARDRHIYLRGVSAFEAFLHDRGMPVAVDAITREHIEAFFAWMLNDGGYAAASAKPYYDGGNSCSGGSSRRWTRCGT
jgi:hypothetical protein